MTKQEMTQAARKKRAENLCSAALAEALSKLDAAADVLVSPTPKAINEVGSILEEAHMWLRRQQPSDTQGLAADVREVQQGMAKVRRLLEGAQRIQRIQVRHAAAVIEVYMPGGRIAPSTRAACQVDVNA